MPSYLIYGLRIQSNHPIPTLAPLEQTPTAHDVAIRLQEWPGWPSDVLERAQKRGELAENQDTERMSLWRTVVQGEHFERWMYANGMSFIIGQRGQSVWANWPPDVPAEYVAVYLLGPVLGYVVHLRGLVCLHASAVLVDGCAVGLMGAPGAGKSTTSAALAMMGFPLISEDHLALITQGEPGTARWMAQPGYPVVRLWPASVEMLTGARDTLPELVPGFDKRYLSLAASPRMASEPAPLRVIYVLRARVDDPSAPRIVPLNAQERMLALIRNSYATTLLNKDQRHDEFERLGRLAPDVVVRAIVPHRDPARLRELCELIVRDARAYL